MPRLLLIFFITILVYSANFAAPPDCNAPLMDINKVYWGRFDAAVNSGMPKPPCSASMPFDRWYKFIATNTTMTIIVTGEACEPGFMLYKGKCPEALVELACVPSIKCGTNKNPALTFYDLEVGEVYMIRLYSEGPLGMLSNFFSVQVRDVSQEFFTGLQGNAYVEAGNENCVTLVDKENQSGCSIYRQFAGENMENWMTIDLDFTLNFGSLGAASQNGMAFFLTTGPNTCGNSGYGLGAEGMPNSLIVEFDTWDDGVGSTPDIPDDHVTVFMNGDFTTPIAGPISIPGLVDFADGNDHTFRFYWEPYTFRLNLYFDGQLIATMNNIDFIAQCFGGYIFNPAKRMYFGWSSSSGPEEETHKVCYEPHFELQVPQNETISQFLCEGFSYTSPSGMVYSTAGVYYENIVGTNGCDAVRTITLTARPLPTKNIKRIICAGESYLGYASTGSFDFIKNGINCDTIVTLDLQVLDFSVSIFNDNDINCTNDKSYMYAFISNLPSGPGFDLDISYSWTSLDGNIVSGNVTDSILLDKGGTYQVEVTVSGTNGAEPFSCVIQSSSITVFQTYDAPTASIVPNGQLNCGNESMLLDGGLSVPLNISYQWSSASGGIVGSNNENFVTINKPGIYLLTVVHDVSGCIDTQTIKIVKQGFSTIATLAKSSDIDCVNDTISLSALMSDNSAVKWKWSTEDGNILSDTLLQDVQVDSPGDYVFTMYDENDCESIVTIEVTANMLAPVVSAGTDKLLNCDVTTVPLQGTINTASTNYTFKWVDELNNIISETDLLLNLDQSGTFILTVYDSLNHCTKSDTVQIKSDILKPALSPITDQMLTCQALTVPLNGSVTNTGANMEYTWTTVGGNITGSTTSLTSSADQVGVYTIIAKNTTNGCADTTSLSVTGSIDQPDAVAGVDVILDCHNPVSLASGTYSSNDPVSNIVIEWSTVGGNIQGPTNGLNINVASPGLYIISVTNDLNGCTDKDTLQVFQNDDKPIINFDPVLEITCIDDQVDITPFWTNAGGNPTITWQTIGGNIVTVNPDSVITVNQAGEYNITIVNEETGCVTTGGVIIEENKVAPEGSVLPPDELTCSVNTTTIEFTPDVPGNYTYSWTTANGTIVSGANSPTVTVSKEGLYSLEVTNNDNGCKELFSGNVSISNDFPGVNAGQNDILNCTIQNVTLNATVQNVPNYGITWNVLSGGNIVSGNNTLNPVVDAPGTYVLNIENNDNGCAGSDTVVITANITDPQFVSPDITDADCLGEGGSIGFDNISNANGPFTFKLNGQPTSAPNYLFDDLDAGDYTIEVTDANGCKSEFDAEVDKASEVTMTLPDTLLLIYGQSFSDLYPEFEFDTTGMTLGNWTGADYLDCISCINPTITPTYSATLSFSVKDATGCEAEDEVYIRVRKKEGDFFIPTTFTPGDRNGINDKITVFTDPYTIPVVDEFRIFNRWGTEVFGRTNFTPNDTEQGWNGFFKGSICNPGVYVYYAKMKTVDGEPILVKGGITLIK